MGFQFEANISALTVFLQGLLSFLSPCVLPLLPLYLGYLSGGAKTVDESGNVHYRQGKVLANTLFFLLGISFAFFLLGMGATALGQFFSGYQIWISRIGGVFIILFGLYQLGVFRLSFLASEKRISFDPSRLGTGALSALALGFTFSFSWTPCIGPTLASVLLMATSSSTPGTAFLLIGVYTAGFCIPFLLVGLFTARLLAFFKKNQRVVRYTVKAGGVLMIAMGIMMLTGWMDQISGTLAGPASQAETSYSGENAGTAEESETEAESMTETETTQAAAKAEENADETEAAGEKEAAQTAVLPDAPNFTLTDQYGSSHTLSDYQGKTVFLNFWATWCPPCKSEIPEIQALYEDWDENSGDLVVLGIAAPNSGQEGSVEDITAFLEENGYTFPVVMDESGLVFYLYQVTAFPTTFMITEEGKIYGYVPGAMTRDIMDMIVEQTMEGSGAE